MKWLPLLFANLKRKKTRSLMTLGSFIVAFFLYGLLATINDAFNQGIEIAGADRLVVRNRISLIMPLPESYKEQLKQIQGISGVTYGSWFGGVYKEERNFFPQFAIDTDTYRDMFPEYIIPDDQWKEFLKDREGCIVGKTLMNRFNWSLHDRIPIKASIYGGVWEFNICGIYSGKRKTDDTSQFWFHHKYLDERRQWGHGTVGWYYAKVDNPDNALRISETIDNRFANSPFETTTETEKSFAAGFVRQFGNIKLIIRSVGAVVFFTLILITGSNMAVSIRERTGEIAILKTLGMSRIRVLVLVLSESVLYALIGGGIGIGLAKLYTLGGDPTKGMLPLFYLSGYTIGSALTVAALVGITAGLIPAVNALNLRIADGLRRV
ncbi:ABC transporter permease [bacterium]|nr:ABC transporter permease [candidate division CSSED10-310 bacterium]